MTNIDRHFVRETTPGSGAGPGVSPLPHEIPDEPPREKLPNRRRLERHHLSVGDHDIEVDIGYSAAGKPAEVFIAGLGTGSQLSHLAQDAATLISLALQHGIRPTVLAKSIARQEAVPDASLALGEVGKPATMIGAVLDLLAKAESVPALPLA